MMKKIIPVCFVAALLWAAIGCTGGNQRKDLYEENWTSLSRHEPMPGWLRDGKFGVYFTWGLYTVPEAFTEWYPRAMYEEGNPVFEHHKSTYGDQSEFGYHHFVPMFTAEKFDAETWADAVKESGAVFGGLVAEHHDGYSLWKSDVNPWNTAATGPERDISGELERAIRARGLKFLATFHHARQLQRNACEDNGGGYDSHFIYNEEWHTSSKDAQLRLLYGNMTEEEFHEFWFDKLKEVIDGYSPDLIYFDSWLNLIPEEYRQRFCAYYFNRAEERGQQVGVTYKQNDFPLAVGIKDIEQGGHLEIHPVPWMTDATITFGSWSYTTDNSRIKPSSMVIHSLIDIVSKNGVLLLNGSPRADGSIPDDQRQVFREIGQWLRANGEAIYGTRPWWIHGAGSTSPILNVHGGMTTTNVFTSDDYRYTQSKDGKSLYLIFLGPLEPGKRIRIRDLAPHRYPPTTPVKKVVELETGAEVLLEQMDNAFYFTVPDIRTNDVAVVFKMMLE